MQQAIDRCAAEIWAQFRALYPQLPNAPPVIKVDKRIRQAFAYTYGPSLIRLSYDYRKYPSLYHSEIIPHEIAHCVDSAINENVWEDNDGHGEGWQKLMRQIGKKPLIVYDLPTEENHEKPS